MKNRGKFLEISHLSSIFTREHPLLARNFIPLDQCCGKREGEILWSNQCMRVNDTQTYLRLYVLRVPFRIRGSDELFYVDIGRLLMRSISNVVKLVERNKIQAHCLTNGPIMTVVSAAHHKEIQKRKSRFLFITFKFKTVRDLFMLVAVAMSMRRTRKEEASEASQVCW